MPKLIVQLDGPVSTRLRSRTWPLCQVIFPTSAGEGLNPYRPGSRVPRPRRFRHSVPDGHAEPARPPTAYPTPFRARIACSVSFLRLSAAGLTCSYFYSPYAVHLVWNRVSLSSALGVPAPAIVIHSTDLGVAAVLAAVIAGRRSRTFASRMLTLIFGLNFDHRCSPP